MNRISTHKGQVLKAIMYARWNKSFDRSDHINRFVKSLMEMIREGRIKNWIRRR